MKIAVVGASGLIGTKVVGGLGHQGHEVVAASRGSGVDVLTGDGLGEALARANVLVDVTNSPSFEDEFTEAITASLTIGNEVRVPDALIQPIAADDVAAEVVRVATGEPLNGVVNIGGPEKISFERMAREVLARQVDDKPVIVDPQARYFGTPVRRDSLVT